MTFHGSNDISRHRNPVPFFININDFNMLRVGMISAIQIVDRNENFGDVALMALKTYTSKCDLRVRNSSLKIEW
jgi:hypothetical protein